MNTRSPKSLLDDLCEGAEEVRQFLNETGANTYYRDNGNLHVGPPPLHVGLSYQPFRGIRGLVKRAME